MPQVRTAGCSSACNSLTPGASAGPTCTTGPSPASFIITRFWTGGWACRRTILSLPMGKSAASSSTTTARLVWRGNWDLTSSTSNIATDIWATNFSAPTRAKETTAAASKTAPVFSEKLLKEFIRLHRYLQDFLPHVGQAGVREGWVDFVGLGRMVLSYPELLRHVVAAEPVRHKLICRTFSDCTTAPRNGLASGCYPLDRHYKTSEAAARLKIIKTKH